MIRADMAADGVVYALDFSMWKRRALRCCFPGKSLKFVSHPNAVPFAAHVAVWGMTRQAADFAPAVLVQRVEDGFLRSVGLGTDLIRPLSWVLDKQGIYYDATRPSDLEALLSDAEFDIATLQRASALAARIASQRLTKYNVGGARWERPSTAQRVVLVPGQVETDASLSFGAPVIRGNLALLQAVRQANPGAYVVYKPHPDVISGLRAQGAEERQAIHSCDEIVTDVAMGDLLPLVDEVHVLTSLAGFEALLRGKPVTCYGLPFYAGWGLTTDLVPIARRQRRLTLNELVAGALILYPLYMNRAADRLVTPEEALDELLLWKAKKVDTLPWWREWVRVGIRRIVGVR